MEKFLYFAVSATAQTSYPKSAFRGVTSTGAGKINLYFTPMIDAGQDTTADEVDKIILSCGADEKVAIKAIVDAISSTGSMKEAFIVIADTATSVFLSGSGITACDSITYAA